MSTPPWMDTLLAPRTYPEPPETVRLVQTHISWVFLAGETVYKVKKPVDFGFLDFTTLDRRAHFCREEVRLNRRLCPDIYLGVVPITETDGTYALDGPGRVVEWAVAMRRLPEAGMMQRLIGEERLGPDEMERIVRRLVPFYREAASGPDVLRHGGLDTVRFNTEENFEQAAPFVGDLLDPAAFEEIRGYARSFLDRNAGLFAERERKGRIREGHGDLYSANICFDPEGDEVYIFDCIEFNERFRCGDVASDVAFLAMDLDYHGLADLSRDFTDAMARRLPDEELAAVMDFYKCYRAFVRCKIGCFTQAAPGIAPDDREAARREARRYLRLAHRYAGGGAAPTLYVFFGLSGTGKSTLAAAWAEKTGLPLYNSDRVRKEMAGLAPESREWEPFGQGIYDEAHTRRTYSGLIRRAGRHLAAGESVILDATYRSRRERARLRKVAEAAGARTRFVLCTCPEPEIRRRLEDRAAGPSVSDGRWEIYLRQRAVFEPPEDIPPGELVVVETTAAPEALLDRYLAGTALSRGAGNPGGPR
ncbi:AAA family ATPase [Dissulfurirhabdus thermomarina]|uniref:AAA family ATPase n=1 Tax=Dissulfurirhabdus thermomarina TaxID=1765737 RepID=A0A6N9TP66_DISTH|nr:AAA family ATPase [Dissulfurirhabdus thermomarina]NDY42230.1 AAA family ATPase [Dissulfurirhabdus thermomarina]NMX23156.1 AAA family ATPase [Dissulfurirhabdus thermomarina]